MRTMVAAISYFLVTLLVVTGCLIISPSQTELPDLTTVPIPIKTTLPDLPMEDGALRVNIPVEGSLQNPQWSPDSNSLLFTRFRDGYNIEPADLVVVDLTSSNIRVLISD